jgi:Trp operon repressor
MRQRHTRTEVADRRKTIADLLLKGWTQKDIAAHVRVAQATVARDLDEIKRQWRDAAVRDFDQSREQELRKLALVESEAWAGWQRSQAPVQAASLSEGKEGSRRSSSLKHQYGNPRFLEQIARCISQRCLLLGLHPLPVPQEDPLHDRVSLEVRRERVRGLLAQICERERTAQSGTGPGDSQPGGAGECGQSREMAVGAAPDVARPGPAGGN